MWPDLPAPFIFAHRGASAHAPENTLAAFLLAARQGAPAVELDVRLSADGQVVVIHDPTVDRTTDGTGLVADLPLAALKELDAGTKFDVQFKGERIPTLDEFFETAGRQLYTNIELANYIQDHKADHADGMIERVAGIVHRHGLQSRVLFSSFDTENLRRVRSLLPEVPCGLLAGPLWEGRQARRSEWQQDAYATLNPHYLDTTRSLVRRVHARGKRIYAYTVNSRFAMRRLRYLGVDAIITDDPPLARKVFLEQA